MDDNFMSTNVFGEGASPFDQIKLVDENGVDYWLARTLMPHLGYPRWTFIGLQTFSLCLLSRGDEWRPS
jgi:hypothetical protein